MLQRFQQLFILVILLTSTFQVLAQNSMPDKVCVGTERHYRVTGTPNSIYTWRINGEIQNSVGDNIEINWSIPGTFTIDVQEHQDNCSSAIKSGVVTVVDIPILVTTGNLLVWEQDLQQRLDANTQIVPQSGINVVWYDQASGGTALFSPTLNHVGTITYYAEANIGFCSNHVRTSVTLTILPKHVVPTVVSQITNDTTPLVTGTATIATGEALSVSINGITYTAGDGRLTLTGTNWSLQIPSGNEILDGIYSVTATVKDALGNSSTDVSSGELIADTSGPAIPTVNSLNTNDSTPVLTGTAIVAIGETLTVEINGITYTVGDGKLTLSGSIWSLQIISGSELSDGTYSVTATVIDAVGNRSTDQTNNELTIKTNKAPVAVDDVFTINGLVISGNLDINDIAFEGGKLVYNILPVIAPAKGDLIIKDDGTFTYTLKTTGSGTDEFVYEVCDNSSPTQCSQARVVINFNFAGPVARIQGAPFIAVGSCSEEGLLLDGSKSSGYGLTFNWSPSIYLDNPASASPRFISGKSTRYKLTVTDSNGFKDTVSVMVAVITAPKAVTDKNVFVETANESILLNGAKSTGTGLTYLWLSKEGIILSGETQATAQVSGLGMYFLQVTDSFGCLSLDSVNVGIYIQAISDTAQTIVNHNVSINVLRNDIPKNEIDPSSISIVTPPRHGTASIAADSLVLYSPEESYTGQDEFVYAICDYYGNCDNAKVLVLINDLPFFIPEAFSPNGDGINDKFVIKGLAKYRSVEIEIFNRWGNVVFQSNNYGDEDGKVGFWDGTATSTMRVGSGPVPSGTYYYILKMNGNENITGAVYLDR